MLYHWTLNPITYPPSHLPSGCLPPSAYPLWHIYFLRHIPCHIPPRTHISLLDLRNAYFISCIIHRLHTALNILLSDKNYIYQHRCRHCKAARYWLYQEGLISNSYLDSRWSVGGGGEVFPCYVSISISFVACHNTF